MISNVIFVHKFFENDLYRVQTSFYSIGSFNDLRQKKFLHFKYEHNSQNTEKNLDDIFMD